MTLWLFRRGEEDLKRRVTALEEKVQVLEAGFTSSSELALKLADLVKVGFALPPGELEYFR